MSTKTAICNKSLVLLGISDLFTDVDADDRVEADAINAIYDLDVDYVLRDFPWPWATKYLDLQLIDGDSVDAARLSRANNDWVFAYRYPSDCLQARRLVTGLGRENPDPPPFRVGRDYVGENPDDDTTTMTLTTGAGWTTADTITATCSDDCFVAADVGSGVRLTSGNDVVTITIVTRTSATVVSGTPNITVPSALRNAAKTTWAITYDGKIIWTDEEDAQLEYTVAISDEAEFDAQFVAMLAARLAAGVAPALSRLPDMATKALQLYEIEKGRAYRSALNEGQAHEPTEAEWIRGRS
jgi:hypothetical protein